ncbi:hypothetical protein B4135_2593 [Caldibacillus debilis]|uniref:Uncharacterized protein n=1 Tax=Caldibacillus debilis TaxID=301148 RepID=A0A150LWV6_9BACI|nr:hypothetical protein B4135_2593 [Caldibacillus debilis]
MEKENRGRLISPFFRKSFSRTRVRRRRKKSDSSPIQKGTRVHDQKFEKGL